MIFIFFLKTGHIQRGKLLLGHIGEHIFRAEYFLFYPLNALSLMVKIRNFAAPYQ